MDSNKVQVDDMGIDGRIYPVGTKPAEAASKGKAGETDHMFAEDWFPIQVKQMDKVGRPDIDRFEAVMERTARVKLAASADSSSRSAFHPTPHRNIPQKIRRESAESG